MMENLFSGALLVLYTIDCAVSQQCHHTIANSSFIIEPSSNLTTFIGAPAVFNCSYPAGANPESDNIVVLTSWMLNGLFITNTTSSCINGTEISQRRYSLDTPNSHLTIRNVISECNSSILQCVAYEANFQTNSSMIIERSREVILTLQEFPQVEEVELLGRDGTIQITWDEPTVDPQFKNQTITYRLNIIPHDTSDRSSSLMYLFRPYNPSACTTFNITITAYLNSFAGLPKHMIGGSYDGSAPDTNGSVLVTSVTLNGTDLIYEVILSNGEPICYMNLSATHVLSGVAYNMTMKVDTQLNTTLTTFKVGNDMLPFDENYNAIIDVFNPPSNLSSRLICFNLSTHDIQNPTLNNGLLTLGFVKNTPALGAFLVVGDTTSHCYDYIPLKMNNEIDLEFNISDPDSQLSACSSNCTLLIYVLKGDGLPRHNRNSSMSLMENIVAWPVIEYNPNIIRQNLTPETDGQINNTESIDADQVTVDVTRSSESITFTCTIGDDSGDIQGCITVIHSTLNYSALIVNTIDKNSNSSFNLTSMSASQGEEYLYAVFPWSKRSGLLGFKAIKKGGTHELPTDETSNTNESGSDLPPAAITAIVLLFLAVIVAIIIIVVIVTVVLYKWNKNGSHQLQPQETVHDQPNIPLDNFKKKDNSY